LLAGEFIDPQRGQCAGAGSGRGGCEIAFSPANLIASQQSAPALA